VPWIGAGGAGQQAQDAGGILCALAGKSPRNRLGLSRPEPARCHKLSCDAAAAESLLIEVFPKAHKKSPAQIIFDPDTTDDPLHDHQEGQFFPGCYDCYYCLPLWVFRGRYLLAAKLWRPAHQTITLSETPTC